MNWETLASSANPSIRAATPPFVGWIPTGVSLFDARSPKPSLYHHHSRHGYRADTVPDLVRERRAGAAAVGPGSGTWPGRGGGRRDDTAPVHLGIHGDRA